MNDILKCPVCEKQLRRVETAYLCDNKHSFDIAKQGYVNLLQSQTSKIKVHGDSSEMLQARKRILYNGYYKSISIKLNDIILNISPRETIVDIGSGIGYYLDMLEQSISGSSLYGIDISKDGVKECAKSNKNILYTVGTNNKLPYMNDSVDIISSVFSPLNIEECLRVLKTGGHLITVSPNRNHLMELKQLIYTEITDKDYQINEINEIGLIKTDSERVIDPLHLIDNDLYNLFMMTPHFWKSGLEVKEKIARIEEFEVTIDTVINVYRYEKNLQ